MTALAGRPALATLKASCAAEAYSMGKIRHCLKDVNLQLKRAICSVCGSVDLYVRSGFRPQCKNVRKTQNAAYRKRVGPAKPNHRDTVRQYLKNRPYRAEMALLCERCLFVPEHVCQLDVHHKDENRGNNSPENLATLCANCHRLYHVKRLWIK